ncbi:MAG: hypothetical protein VZQ83_05480 [Eubacterium sp.]|nr:hypothetical protein [Eubacterium sp.]
MTEKKAHPKAALVLGVIGILVAILMGVLFGWIAGCVGAACGFIAFGLGMSSRKRTDKEKGKGGITTGILAILFAAAVSVGLVVFSGKIGEIAEERGFPLIAKHARSLSGGIIGMMIEINRDDEDIQDALRELNEMKNKK